MIAAGRIEASGKADKLARFVCVAWDGGRALVVLADKSGNYAVFRSVSAVTDSAHDLKRGQPVLYGQVKENSANPVITEMRSV